MNRSTPQRVGDITLVLAGFAALTLIARGWAAVATADGHAATFWSYAALSSGAWLVAAFAAACASSWMDDQRQQYARWMLFAVFALSAVAIVGDVLFGTRDFSGDRGATLVQDAASLLLVAGGFTLVAGIVPTRDEPREV